MPQRHMSLEPLYSEGLRVRIVALMVGVTLAGFACMLLSSSLPSAWIRLLQTVGSSLVALGLVGLGYELWLRRSVIAQVLEAVGLSTDLAGSGIVEVRRYSEIDWAEFIRQGHGDFHICVAFARNWADENAEAVLKQAARERRTVRLSLLDPAASPAILEIYSGKGAEQTKQLIDEAVGYWKRAAERLRSMGEDVSINLYSTRTVYPYTFYRHGDVMWFVVHSRERSPERLAIRCVATHHPDGFFEWAVRDLESSEAKGQVTFREDL